jgi:hypothetical protein
VVAARLKDLGVSETMAFDLMAEHWNLAPDEGGKADPPWRLDDLGTKVANAYRYGQNAAGKDAPVDPREEFDVVAGGDFGDDPVDLWADEAAPPDLRRGLLPAALDDFVDDEAERKGVERGAVALSALVVCAAAIPAGFEVQVKQHDSGHTDRAIL